jgi:hypothetical protein
MFNLTNVSTAWSNSRRVRFAITVTCTGVAAVALWYWATISSEVVALTVCAAVVVGLVVAGVERGQQKQLACLLERVELPLGLAPDQEMFQAYRDIANGLIKLAQQTDPVLREIAGLRLASICTEVRTLAQGTVVFPGTETWRTAYEKLLLTVTVKAYLSVAWVKTADYWRDTPGERSLRLNHELVEHGYRIERVVIVNDRLWPTAERLPSPEILSWLNEQSDHGIHITLVRGSDLAGEPDLLRDFGIYGTQAVGEQELDDNCRTERFTLRFDQHSIQLAHDRWERLSLYATKLSDLLDQ